MDSQLISSSGGTKVDELPSEDEAEDLKASNKLKLVIQRTNDGEKTEFILKMTTPFIKVFEAWSKRFHVSPRTQRFLFQGEKVLDQSTPKMMEWKAGRSYVIDNMIGQEGG
ncbi:hypothetical protein BCR39DRAFT_528752 [Naematelia encephala]|uniref:Rad60/SUMO-like domain-containing protein n=1 Tax=Naematelia encephala TaxID=71784 RepID=A0A1Y2B6U4_9TREE|nr:hypothetical protein BCR39DRAFT_528752 [Naematelia encephala]